MKKVFVGLVVIMASLSLYAQEPTTYRSTTSTTTSNPGYIIPDPIRVNFESTYPGAVVVNWEPMGEWWHATYNGDNRLTHVYYANTPYYLEHPATYTVALPVMNTFVPADVLSAAIKLHGNNLYSITQMKSSDNSDVYRVTTLQNGMSGNSWMDASGVVVQESDIYKVKVDDDKVKVKVDN
jgi:hypothetical protein